ncbi:MAG: prepilin-type N-terminal cleavage/methylation domain-containing protein [Chloroflexi bacterium]|nr:prepilin-type N-terminal cleavage/methylation domain-containing protein [Chloroflexota bacterium]
MRVLKAGLPAVHKSSRGVTLVEMLLAVAILGITTSIMGSAIFQALSTERYWFKDISVTKDLRHAGSWFARDVINTQTATVADGAPAEASVTLSWTDTDGAPHTVSYGVVAGELKRTYDGQAITVARDVSSAGFSRTGKTLRFALAVNASRGATETKTLDAYGGMLQ